ncbi:phage major capsid protein [Motilibacter rhizosphaerae]|uniref:phage major capsid protein n=1 Tax=Motilibacter rhizosphaerae TaxID=598652 RepID=UPI00102B6E09|nr:phage major capsid protein [Motilibacter rhizosphaerae]
MFNIDAFEALIEKARSEQRGLAPTELAAVLTSLRSETRNEVLAAINAPGLEDQHIERRDALEAIVLSAVEKSNEGASSAVTERRSRVLHAAANAVPGDENRSLIPGTSELRALIAEGTNPAGGYTVPTETAHELIGKLAAASVFLRAPGLQVRRFTGGSFLIPQVQSSSAPGVVAEGASITEGTLSFGAQTFKPIKYASLYRASSEILEDASVDLRNEIAHIMTRDVGSAVDVDAFGAGNGTTALKGLTAASQGTTTNFSTGHTAITWTDILNSVTDIEATGASATVVWASPDQAKPLRATQTTTGEFIIGSPTTTPTDRAAGLPLLVSANLPARTVIVADASRIYVGVRRDVNIAYSADAFFGADSLGLRLTYRLAGINVAEATSVQILKASAS